MDNQSRDTKLEKHRLTLSVEYDNFRPQQSLSEKLNILRSIILEKSPPEASVFLMVKAVEMHFMVKISLQLGGESFQRELHFDLENVNEVSRYWLLKVGTDLMQAILEDIENFQAAS